MSQHQNETSDTSASHLTTYNWESYLQTVGPLLVHVRVACSLPAMSPEEHALATAVWTDLLISAGVPEEELANCVKHVLLNRDSKFPPMVSEICAAWREIGPTKRHPTIREKMGLV